VASPESGPWYVSWSKVPVVCPNTQGCPGMWTNHVGGLFWYRFMLDLLNLLPSLIPRLPTRPSTPFLELEVGSMPPSLNFRNLILWDPQVGFTPWLGSASSKVSHGNLVVISSLKPFKNLLHAIYFFSWFFCKFSWCISGQHMLVHFLHIINNWLFWW